MQQGTVLFRPELFRRGLQILICLLIMTGAGFAGASDTAPGLAPAGQGALEEKMQQLCDQIRRCVWQKLDASALSDEVQSELNQDLQGVCLSIRQDLQPVRQLGVQAQAEACVDSMLALSCDRMIDSTRATPACGVLEQASAPDAAPEQPVNPVKNE